MTSTKTRGRPKGAKNKATYRNMYLSELVQSLGQFSKIKIPVCSKFCDQISIDKE